VFLLPEVILVMCTLRFQLQERQASGAKAIRCNISIEVRWMCITLYLDFLDISVSKEQPLC